MKSRGKSIVKIGLYVGLLSLLVGVGVVSPLSPAAQADPVGENECLPAVLMLRGSGEGQNAVFNYPAGANNSNAYIRTNGYEGKILRRALEAFVEETNPADTVSKLRFVGIDYPALAVEPPLENIPNPLELTPGERDAAAVRQGTITVSHYLNYLDSINQGALEIKDFIDLEMKNGCDTQYILMGYSQGALAARVAMNLMGNNTDKIIGSYLIGDPFQKANAATENQRSAASTGYHRDGVVRKSLDVLRGFSSNPQMLPVYAGLSLISGNLEESDQTAYYENAADGIFSRSLCHDFDKVCWSPSVPFIEGSIDTQHENYFELKSDPNWPGSVDIDLETSGFDAQLKALADSETANPRARLLTRTLLVGGKSASYTIANTRPDDTCSWDEGSDGIFEQTSCGEYPVTPTGSTAKMTVQVKDSFGITYTLSSEEDVIDPSIVESLSGVPYDRWVRFESYLNPTECVTIPQHFDQGTDDGPYGAYLKSLPCLESPSQNFDYNATQIFKRVHAINDADEPIDHYLWGYDEDYRIDTTSSAQTGQSDFLSFVIPTEYGDDGYSGAEVELAQIIDDVPYYQFKAFRGANEWCASQAIDFEDYTLELCDSANEHQLFRAVLADPDDEYGSLSLEKDTTPPNPVTNFELTSRSGAMGYFSWYPATDDRTDAISYYIIDVYDSYLDRWSEVELLERDLVSTAIPLSWMHTKVRIRSYDYAWNVSDFTVLNL